MGENPKREEQQLREADRNWGIGESYRERKELERVSFVFTTYVILACTKVFTITS